MDSVKTNKVRIGFVLISITAIVLVGTMTYRLYRLSDIESERIENLDEKSEMLLLQRKKYTQLESNLENIYVLQKKHSRSVFRKTGEKSIGDLVSKKKPKKLTDFATLEDRIDIEKIYQKPVKLLFKGYMQLGDGTNIATINWAGKTSFVKTGEEIRGYTMRDFKKEVANKDTFWGGTEKIDSSYIMLEKNSENSIKLMIGKVALEKEIFAQLLDNKTNTIYDVHVGSDFLTYTVKEILPGLVSLQAEEGKIVEIRK